MRPKTIGDLWRQREAMERRSSLSDPPGWMVDSFGGFSTNSGVHVQGENALRSTAVYACVALLAKSVAGLPLILMEDYAGGRRPAKNHPLFPILRDLPNELMTSFEMREAKMCAALLRGNGYSRVVRNGFGEVVETIPIHPDFVLPRVTQDRRSVIYEVRIPGTEVEYLVPGQIWHIKGMTLNGLIGVSPITFDREAVGLGLAMEEHGARVFSNGARPDGYLRLKEGATPLGEEEYSRSKASWQESQGGNHNRHKTAVLEGDWEYVPLSMTSTDAQYIEGRRFQLEEIARIFGIPLHKLQSMERATFSNIEHQGIEFVEDTLRPWLIRWEQSIKRDLLLPNERDRYHVVFNVDALLRGDTQSRWNAHKTAIESGAKSRAEVRRDENLDPGPPELNDFLVPMNFQTLEQAAAAEPPGAEENAPGSGQDAGGGGSDESEADDAS